jgi:CubicO group peptidase (beta-lactamase class C family)
VRALAALALLAGARIAAADPAAIKKLLDEQRQQLHIAGLAYAVVVDDRIVAIDGLGLRDVERKLPATPDTIFPIGSCTKAFTAMAAAIAADEGKLALDDSPHKYLPFVKLRDAEANELVTIRDMLSHRSGLRAYADLAALPGVLTREQYLKAAIGAKPAAKLREKFQYSNAMVTAVGEIEARLYKTTWERVIETKILAPLGMTATRTSSYKLPGEAALGYAWDGAAWKATPVTESLGVMAPAGAVASTARDMTRWLRVLAGGGALEGKRLVSEAMLRELTTPAIAIDGTLSYALGWAVYDWNGHRVVEHNGGSEGLSALVSLMPDKHAGFVVLANSSPTALTQIGKLGAKLWPLIVNQASKTAPPNAPSRSDAVKEPELSTKDLPALDPLLARMVQAAGGERNLRAHHALRLTATGAYEHQGVTLALSVLATETARVEDESWTAAGVRIGRIRQVFDGTKGGQQTTFGQDEEVTDVAKARRENALHPLLDLKGLYGTVKVAGKTLEGGEDVYVLALGTDTKLYVSARTALVFRRDRGGEITRFYDFRTVDGEVVPFTWTTTDALGDKTVHVAKLDWNVAIPPGSFAKLPKLAR